MSRNGTGFAYSGAWRGLDVDRDWPIAGVGEHFEDRSLGLGVRGAVDELDAEPLEQLQTRSVLFRAAEMCEDGRTMLTEEDDGIGRHLVETADLDTGAGKPEDAAGLVRLGEGALDGGSPHRGSHPPESASCSFPGRSIDLPRRRKPGIAGKSSLPSASPKSSGASGDGVEDFDFVWLSVVVCISSHPPTGPSASGDVSSSDDAPSPFPVAECSSVARCSPSRRRVLAPSSGDGLSLSFRLLSSVAGSAG